MDGDKMKALVLSGGGSKGSYQLGVWKALKKLNIKVDIVTGTSVGALNGALITQKSYKKAKKIWNELNMKVLFGEDIDSKKDIIKLYGKQIKNGGMDITKLEKMISDTLNTKKFYKSKINYGLVTVNLTNLKAEELEKKDIDEDKLDDYLIASASCYPAFKQKDIERIKYIDGGYYDNLPINLAIKMGATEIICVDLRAPGLKKDRKNKNIPITTITPNNKLSNFLDFSNKVVKRNISYGYNDTMKVFNKLEGRKYTFKKNSLKRNSKDYEELYNYILKKILSNKKIENQFNKIIENLDLQEEKQELKQNLFQVIVENTGKKLLLDDTKIYSMKEYNKELIKKIKKKEITIDEQEYIKLLKENKYDEIRKKAILHPKELLRSIYLYVLIEA